MPVQKLGPTPHQMHSVGWKYHPCFFFVGLPTRILICRKNSPVAVSGGHLKAQIQAQIPHTGTGLISVHITGPDCDHRQRYCHHLLMVNFQILSIAAPAGCSSWGFRPYGQEFRQNNGQTSTLIEASNSPVLSILHWQIHHMLAMTAVQLFCMW